MRFEREVYAFKDVEQATTEAAINSMLRDFNSMVEKSDADWFEEETRFVVGDLTFVVFKFTYLNEDVEVVMSDEQVAPVRYIPIKWGPVEDKHFSTSGVDDTPIKKPGRFEPDVDSWWF